MNIQPRIFVGRGPEIGDRAAFWQVPGVVAIGSIVDIRDMGEPAQRTASVAVLGWPYLGQIPVSEYHELRDGVWRACSHSRGFNAAGLCFDCGSASRDEGAKRDAD